jgi:hypothetical protein
MCRIAKSERGSQSVTASIFSTVILFSAWKGYPAHTCVSSGTTVVSFYWSARSWRWSMAMEDIMEHTSSGYRVALVVEDDQSPMAADSGKLF